MKNFFIFFINFYQQLSKWNFFGYSYNPCVFYPTCSEYSKKSIAKYGAIKGLYFSFRRVVRCHPYQKNKIDPVL